MSRLITLAGLLLLILSSPTLAKQNYIEGTINRVDASLSTFWVNTPQGQRQVSVLVNATVLIGGRPGKLQDLRQGDHVQVNGVTLNNGNTIANQVISYGTVTNYSFQQPLSMQPSPNSQISNARPQITANFPFRVDSFSVFVDGLELTQQSRASGNTVSWTPNYDLDHSSHRVMIIGRGNGRQETANWNFNIAPAGRAWPDSHAQQLMPAPNSTASKARPEMGAVFPENVQNVTLLLDGRDHSRDLTIWGNKATWTPNNDLEPRQHTVAVTGVGASGRHYSDTWTFNAAAAAAKVDGYSPAPGEVLTVFRPTISANFAESIQRTKVTMTVDGVDVTASANIATQRVEWTPNYDLAFGKHEVRITISDRNGNQSEANWSFTIAR